MFVRIDNTPRDYAWGSPTAIARLLGREPSGSPEAELWLGAHPGSPARILSPAQTGGARDLAAWIAADPEQALGASGAVASAAGDAPRLPFLLKILAAAGPLSLQAHPSPAQARAGFERENAAGIPLDAPDRNYKDAFHKPEMIFALSETFDALCGFRSLAAIEAELAGLVSAAADASLGTTALAAFRARLNADADSGSDSADAPALRDAVEWLLSGGGEIDALVRELVAAARLVLEEHGAEDFGEAVDPVLKPLVTVVSLAEAYPGDPGIALSLLLNRVTLRRGQALYLPAGNIHAYLEGLGVELMAASDNVLRGGLTPKHIDIPELLSVLDFTPLPAPLLDPLALAEGVEAYRPDVPDFQLVHLAGEGVVALAGPAVAIAVAGHARLAGASGSVDLERGEAVYITPEEGVITKSGTGEIFLATVG